jgi:hypothetical protein
VDPHLCRFFPTTVYLSTSKLAVAAVGNLSFAMALCMYNLVIKVGMQEASSGPAALVTSYAYGDRLWDAAACVA